MHELAVCGRCPATASPMSTTFPDTHSLAQILSASSPGRSKAHREILSSPSLRRMSIIVGETDAKYVALAQRMQASRDDVIDLFVVPGCGHAVHIEAPITDLSHLLQHITLK